jgi:hypothetical protein
MSRYHYFFLQGEGPADHSGEGAGGGEGETGGERGGQSGGGTTAANPAVISHSSLFNGTVSRDE